MQQYLSEPSRIIYASWDNKDIEPKGDGVFRMRVTSQSFLSVSIDMFVDLEVAVKGDGKIGCKSIGFSVDSMGKFLGQEFVDTFFLELDGELRVEETETKLRNLTLKQALLTGDVGVSIGGKVRTASSLVSKDVYWAPENNSAMISSRSNWMLMHSDKIEISLTQ